MMKRTDILLLSLVLINCISGCGTQAKKAETITDYSVQKPDLILKSEAFKASKGENWNQNNVIEARTNSEYKDSLTIWVQSPSILNDLEFRFEEIQQGERDGEQVNAAVFWLNSHMSSMLVAGIISDDMVNRLKSGQVYKLRGNYLGEVEHWPVELEENNKFSLGSHRFLISEVEEVQNPESKFY